MSIRRPFVTLAAAAVVAAAVTAGPASAATVPNGPASSADAYGLLVDTQLLPTHTPVRQGPIARATQDYPPGAADPSYNQVLSAGPAPSDGSVVNHIGVMTSIAGANGAPLAVAASEVADVSLLGATGSSLITADLVRAQSNSDCATDPNAAGTTFAGLVVNGTPITNTPAPNTVIDLVVAKVILNEQHPANDGRGLVVNAIHVVSTTTGDPLLRGDIIVSHAMSTVNCPGGPGSTGGGSTITMAKDAAPTVATAGTEVTYTAQVKNTGTVDCLVNEFIEHLAPAFEFVSTSGDFGTALDRTVDRAGGGTDLILGNGKTLAGGATFSQTFVVKVKDGAAPGVYFNNLEILCSNIGDFVKGLDAPVQVVDDEPSPIPTPTVTPPKPECSDGKDNDGDGKVDYPKDPGCSSALDDDERDVMPRTGGTPAWPGIAAATLLALAVTARRFRVQ
ncbi:MAG TPA: choice-of-anchor P family protein [Mycobacteriales bacterium]|nr:choice-of-anchor P family protein [Mycobacteriales bacterium]